MTLPRLSYLAFLLPRLHAFFAPCLITDPDTVSPDAGYFTYDSVPLKWHLPLGLLYDIYVLSTQDAGADRPSVKPLPFRLTLHFTPDSTSSNVNLIDPTPIVLHDSFINSVKEADFLRSGTAKPIMTLPTHDSKALWSSTQENDLPTFARIHHALLPAPGQMRNIPLRVYLPSSPGPEPSKAQIKVLQSHVPPTLTATSASTVAQRRSPGLGQPQTVGTALHSLLPSLFPSRRTPILATPLLHGAPVPMAANLEDLARWACYADGWLSVVVAMRS